MKVTYSWLKEFIDIDISPSELVEVFENLGIEVEDFRYLGNGLKGKVFVGEIVDLKPHPEKPEWKVIRVNIGKDTLTSVSGAPNLEKGGKVVYAVPGAILPNGLEVKTVRLRGIDSVGMPLSDEEIGVPIEAKGIINLPKEFRPGEDPLPHLELDDWVYDLYITPNRPDLLSVLGIAREISVKLEKRVRELKPQLEISKDVGTFGVEVKAPEGCPRYTLRVQRDVIVKESSPKIRYRLAWCGLRPINNIVDITNYVLLELGQPIHAFDLSKVKEEIIVRFAREGEKILTLDGVERILNGETLLIADKEGPLAVAGIMGGEESGVTEATRDILIESAYFDPLVIRKGTSYLGLSSESSIRFARGTDPALPPLASDRVAELVTQEAKGKAGPLVDKCFVKSFHRKIILRKNRVDDLLGVEVPSREIRRIFNRLGFGVETEGRGKKLQFHITVPSRRVDMEWEADLIEEIARFHGYENIPETFSKGGSFTGKIPEKLSELLRGFLLEIGFVDTIGLDFLSAEDLKAMGFDPEKDAVKIRNPLGEPYEYLRTSLLPSLLQAASNNLKKGNQELRLFEVGKVFFWRGERELPREPLHVAAVVTGEKSLHWRKERGLLTYYDLKGVLDHLSKRLKVTFHIESNVIPFLETGGRLYLNGQPVGWIGEIKKTFLKRYDIKIPVYAFEVELPDLEVEKPRYTPLPKFPPVKRDISLLVNEEITYKKVAETILKSKLPYLKEIRLIDLYRGKPLMEGTKSLTFSLTFQNPERTLTDEEVDGFMAQLMDYLTKEGYQIRGVADAT